MKNLLNYKELIIDTEPLLILLVGIYDTKKLSRVSGKTEDFNYIVQLLRLYKKGIVTPQILAEVSNHAQNQLKGNFPDFIDKVLSYLKILDEKYVCKDKLLNKIKEIKDFGISDVSLIEISNENRLILTKDKDFLYYCKNKNMPVVSYKDLAFYSSIKT